MPHHGNTELMERLFQQWNGNAARCNDPGRFSLSHEPPYHIKAIDQRQFKVDDDNTNPRPEQVNISKRFIAVCGMQQGVRCRREYRSES